MTHIAQLAYSLGVAQNVIYVGTWIVTSKTYDLPGQKKCPTKFSCYSSQYRKRVNFQQLWDLCYSLRDYFITHHFDWHLRLTL